MARKISYIVILTLISFMPGCWLFGAKQSPPDTREFLPDALQRYDFKLDGEKLKLTVQFRRGGRSGDGLVIEAPDSVSFDGRALQSQNTVESFGELLNEVQVYGFGGEFPASTNEGMLSLSDNGKTYFHKIEIPNVRFGKFAKEYDPKKPIRLPLPNGEKLARGRWKLMLKSKVWGDFGIFWLPGESQEKSFLIGSGKKVYFDNSGGEPALVLNLPVVSKAKDVVYFSVGLYGEFPCNSTDELPPEDQKTGLQCTYEIPYQDIYMTGQAPKPVNTNTTTNQKSNANATNKVTQKTANSNGNINMRAENVENRNGMRPANNKAESANLNANTAISNK